MWFLVSKRHADGFEYEDEKECDGDAWEGHSNRSSMLADYLCVRLTKAQLMSQRQRVRVASYRWQGVKREGKMGLTAPNNYEWFLAFIDAEALVGWMDFMSNVIVGVETKLTLAYMGMLYAEVPTCAEWLREPSKIPEAMSRGWIYQESTFGQLDPSLARQLSDYLYDEYRKEHTPASARAMVEMIWNIALLLLRRGHENAFTADPEDMGGWGKYYDRQRGFFIGGAAAAYWKGLPIGGGRGHFVAADGGAGGHHDRPPDRIDRHADARRAPRLARQAAVRQGVGGGADGRGLP